MNIEELNAHIQTTHLVLKVNIVKDVFIVACDHCEYKCTSNIQLKNHIRKKHPSNEKYNCRECEFASNYVADLWKHTYEEHSDQTSQFDQKEVVNMCLRMCAEQHMEVLEEMETMKSDMKGAFKNMADIMEASVGNIKDDTEEKCKTLANTVIKLYRKISKLELASKAKNESQSKPKLAPVKEINEKAKLSANGQHNSKKLSQRLPQNQWAQMLLQNLQFQMLHQKQPLQMPPQTLPPSQLYQ